MIHYYFANLPPTSQYTQPCGGAFRCFNGKTQHVVSFALNCNLEASNPSHNLSPNKILTGLDDAFKLFPTFESVSCMQVLFLFTNVDYHCTCLPSIESQKDEDLTIKTLKSSCCPWLHRWPSHHHSIWLNYLTLPPNRHVIRDNALLLSAPIWVNSSQRNEILQQSVRERGDEGFGVDSMALKKTAGAQMRVF